jgi:hypothetical protein
MTELKIGVSGLGVLHSDESVPDVETKFAMIRETEVFDYMDRTPPKADLDKHLEASAKYGIPIYAGGFSIWWNGMKACLSKICGSGRRAVRYSITYRYSPMTQTAGC